MTPAWPGKVRQVESGKEEGSHFLLLIGRCSLLHYDCHVSITCKCAVNAVASSYILTLQALANELTWLD